MKRIAIVVSHPIQHFCPQYGSIAKVPGLALRVFFGSAMGLNNYFDKHFKQEISWKGLNLDSFDHFFLNNKDTIPVDKNLDAPDLEAGLSSFKPDIVIVYGYSQKLSGRAVRWAKRNGVKTGYIADSELNNGKKDLVKDTIKQVYLRYYFRKIDFFFSVGHSNRLYYKKYGVRESSICRMHFPIDVEVYKKSWLEKQALRQAVRAQYGISDNELVISVVGKLVSWKSQSHLVDAASVLESKGISVTIFIVGSGEDAEEIRHQAEKLVKSKVIITGFISPEDLPGYYAASDIYAHPAAFEPHSLAISEAIYMGLPVIISNRCGSFGPDDDVEVNKNGFVYPFGDIGELSGYIAALAADRQKMNAFGEASRRIAVTNQEIAHRECWTALHKVI